MELGKFEVFKDEDKKWRFRLVSINGRIVLQSEGYVSSWNALRGIATIKRLVKGGCDIFVLK